MHAIQMGLPPSSAKFNVFSRTNQNLCTNILGFWFVFQKQEIFFLVLSYFIFLEFLWVYDDICAMTWIYIKWMTCHTPPNFK